ncbi:MAG: single-stranded DNA-binding protein [Candidatus Euphemobacter frigidus]|nr:single-stranded DNA-binding protein [Candidatus Euphemobacter frigidus]MDP8275913.1 single-stranded DNA-binding protein [Candidatus Euphemobacter frigidus]
MVSINTVILGGNLTRDPEVRYTPQGTAVARLGLAINQVYRTKDGEKREDVCFVDVEVWARQAETCGEYLKKGSSVLIEGSLKLDTWTDRESGQKRSKHKIRARRVQFLSTGAPASSRDNMEDVAPPPAPYEVNFPPETNSPPEEKPEGEGDLPPF